MFLILQQKCISNYSDVTFTSLSVFKMDDFLKSFVYCYRLRGEALEIRAADQYWITDSVIHNYSKNEFRPCRSKLRGYNYN